MDTIFALSSGAPPAGIAVFRLTGPAAGDVVKALTGIVPKARQATRAWFRDADGNLLDDGLVLFFPGPNSVTGENVAEFHCHGGRAVVSAVSATLASMEGLRAAEPGEFTRRAFANGRIDLAEAEGLADLLSAETELQRRSAIQMASGRFSAQIERWREGVLQLSAQIEALLDFDDEDDVTVLSQTFAETVASLVTEIDHSLMAPRAEVLKEGFRIALAGPPNAGKSTLFNALVESEAAITADIPGTTRDVLTRSIAISGIPFTFVDMAGLRDDSGDVVEKIGIERAAVEMEKADVVLWLGDDAEVPEGAWNVEPQIDRSNAGTKANADFRVSAKTGEGLDLLRSEMIEHARSVLPKPNEAALNQRQFALLTDVKQQLAEAAHPAELLITAERLRSARAGLDALIGHTTTEDVLDTLFGRFCIGK